MSITSNFEVNIPRINSAINERLGKCKGNWILGGEFNSFTYGFLAKFSLSLFVHLYFRSFFFWFFPFFLLCAWRRMNIFFERYSRCSLAKNACNYFWWLFVEKFKSIFNSHILILNSICPWYYAERWLRLNTLVRPCLRLYRISVDSFFVYHHVES